MREAESRCGDEGVDYATSIGAVDYAWSTLERGVGGSGMRRDVSGGWSGL